MSYRRERRRSYRRLSDEEYARWSDQIAAEMFYAAGARDGAALEAQRTIDPDDDGPGSIWFSITRYNDDGERISQGVLLDRDDVIALRDALNEELADPDPD